MPVLFKRYKPNNSIYSIGENPPRDKKSLWVDTNLTQGVNTVPVLKYYDENSTASEEDKWTPVLNTWRE